MIFICFKRISWNSRVGGRETCGPLPPSANEVLLLQKPLYSIAAGWHFIDFHDFLVSWDFMRFHGFRASGVEKPVGAFAAECQRGPAPLETFTRSQVAAISKIFHGFSRFSLDFMRFHGFRGSGVEKPVESLPPSATEVLLLQKPSLDPSWLLFHRCPWLSMIFISFQRISWDFMDFRSPWWVLAAIALSSMDFHDFHRF